ncbi:MAG: urease accessory protein ureD [Methylibium sp. NZG]|nr:MAG: urease accessory protein ureD [Methylibium sp. NZG]
MTWHAHLKLNYRREATRTVVHDRHSGPLRVLASLYPEAPTVCHNVLVHPPGGIVGGDVLEVEATLGAGSHALITTPGAARFYRSNGAAAHQSVRARVEGGARLEWLPLQTTCHRGALAHNRMQFELEANAEMIGWDIVALGLPASGEAFDRGRYEQHIELPGVWLDRGVIDGEDRRLLDSPLGWAGHRAMGTLWLAGGSGLSAARREALLDAAREVCAGHALRASAGSTSPHEQLVLLRVLAPRVEALMDLLTATWARWRMLAWGLPACAPRVWRT